MKIVVIGGTGVLGAHVVDKLRDHGDEAVAASPRTGVNTLTGAGLADALTGAGVVVDVSNSPSFDDGPVMEFFTKSTANLVAAATVAGVGHYVAVSIVGADQLPKSGYLRAKLAQEKLIEESGIPYSIVRATQFAEFTDAITASLTVGDEVRVPDALIQPIAAAELAAEVARVAAGEPLSGIENVGGPRKISFEQMAQEVLDRQGEAKTVVVDPEAAYFGTPLSMNSLVTA
ncbi:SDR family oxidoreductase [Mycobacterium haemophilum]|uniref:LysR family transcriptional regulator n=1 Tax=Mycobacterium haemophilum TaxID=29311 RepID=A0A0I9UFA8_9MYCO|nr:SDR family oxidoreductase [Mycobacterium haemophilum]KLO25830.1 LysR family transcriptional regulator [Mycobacterium haemophilum]KLO34331.1 LysR family transcriptional regulator [Mycobacterium haemophilum]KLO40448.1 LysR family transcriptional regulator [Mycobacterium haemophilum]KLO47941.1 LysR family transcriptional regulator [Mycobacterium haemophilum]